MSEAAAAGPPQHALPSIVAHLWERHRTTNLERVAVLEAAAAALLGGELGEELRDSAERAAHKLAGSLGTFGLHVGTQLAREAESHLNEPRLRGRRLAEIAATLGALIEGTRSGDGAAGAVSGAGAADARARAANPPGPTDDADRSRVALLLSADAELAERLRVAAVAGGMELHVAPDRAVARAALGALPGAVLLVDLACEAWPGGLGEIVAAAAPAPVLALSGSGLFGDRLEAVRCGVRMYLDRSLPAEHVIAAAGQATRELHSPEATVLAVDDDPIVLDTLTAVLGAAGLRTIGLADPLEFGRLLEEASPDLVIVDINMPGVNGLELCRVLRADPRWQHVPVLVLTATTDTATVREAFAAGVDDYVTKPVIGPELQARVTAHAERARLQRELADTDPLTGADNRRRATSILSHLISLAERRGDSFSLAVIDVDRFKEVNDSAGHAAGDAVLRTLCALLRRTFRAEDALGRFGGDEFVLGMYGMSAADGVARLEAVLARLGEEIVLATDGSVVPVSFSAGIAELSGSLGDVDALYRAADSALYCAKEERGRIVCAEGAALPAAG